MKKKLLPISLLCLLGMIVTACGGGSSQESNNSASSNPQSQESSDQGGSSSQEAGKSSSSENSSSAQASSSSQAQSSSQQASSSSQAQSSSQAPNPTGVTLDKTSASVIKGQTLQLTATVAPANANNKEIQWSSEDEDIVTVSKTGLVNAVGYGEAKVTAKIKGTNLKAECVVSVIDEINSITIKNKSVFTDFLEDDIESLSIEVDPAKNVSELVTAGVLKVTSSDTEVASISGLTITGKKAGKSTITATLFGKSDSFELTVGAAIPGEPYTILNAMNKGIVEAPFNGNTGKTSAITTTCFELKGLIMAVAANGETGYNAILDDGTAAVYLQVNKASADPIPVAVGDYAQVTCKFTNYYGLLEGVARTAETNKNASWIPAKDVVKLAAPETPIVPTLNAPVDMTGDQYNEYFAICKTNGTKNAAGATWTAMKYVNILGTYNQAFADADKGKYQISDKYGLAPIGEFKLDEPFDGQKSTLTAFLIGANTGKGKSNAIVTGQTPVAVESFVFDQAPQTIVHGNTLQLSCTTTPAGSYSRNVEWSSSDNTVATVDEKGLVTGIYEGSGSKTATIKVKMGELEQSVVITVFGETVHATAVELAPTASVYVGDDLQLTYTTTPAMISDTPVWSSDNEAVATVNQKGLVKGVATGTANITLKLNDNVSARCAVTVSVEPGSSIDNPLTVAQAIAIGQELAHNKETEKQYFIKGFVSKIVSNDLATDYANATFWLANGEDVVEGFEAYRVKLANGVDGSNLKVGAEVVLNCKIKRYNSTIETNTGALISSLTFAARPVTSLSLDNETLTLEEGATATLKATYAPVYTTESLVWSSSDATVATVDNGKVTAVAAGTAVITVKASDTMSASCTVTVEEAGGGEVPATTTISLTAANLLGYSGTNIAYPTDSTPVTATVGEAGFAAVGCGAYGDGIQMRTKNGIVSAIYNTTELDLNKLEFVWAASKTVTDKDYNLFVEFSNKADFSELVGTKQQIKIDVTSKLGEATPTAAAKYFRVTHANQGAVYLDAINVICNAASQQEAAQPTGGFHGLAKTAAGAFIPVDMTLTADSVALSINGEAATVTSYKWDGVANTISIVTEGAYGTISASFADNVFTITGLTGAAVSQLDLTYAVKLSGNCQFIDCSVMTLDQMNATFIRRYDRNDGNGWQINNPSDGRISVATKEGRTGLQCNGFSTGKVGFTLKNDLPQPISGEVIKSVGCWIYNPGETSFQMTLYAYKGANRTNNAELNTFTIQPGWHFYQTGVVNGSNFKTTDSFYNFQFYYANVSVNPVFDDLCIYM